jgi:hypothetical protein
MKKEKDDMGINHDKCAVPEMKSTQQKKKYVKRRIDTGASGVHRFVPLRRGSP